jgi:hypothetical protein
LDWYFGIRRLLESGARPHIILLSLSTDELASPFTLGESFAYRQMSIQDFPTVIREVSLDRTTTTTYLLAHWSKWIAYKGFIRQCITVLMIPDFRELAAHIADHGAHVHDPVKLSAAAKQRLTELAALSNEFGIRILLLVPPTLHEDFSAQIVQIGESTGVPVLVPSPPGQIPVEYYTNDRFHLNPTGARTFTSRLILRLQSIGQMDSPRVKSGLSRNRGFTSGRVLSGQKCSPLCPAVDHSNR